MKCFGQFVRDDGPLYFLAVLVSLIFIVLVFFKFLPDIGTAVVQDGASALVSWQVYEHTYFRPNSVHHSRFLGNVSLFALAKQISAFIQSGDIRLHPLRVAATLLTMFWFVVALAPVHMLRAKVDWKVYLATFCAMFMAGLYVFYPCDAPGLAWLTLALVFILREQMTLAFICLLVLGLFRESAFHVVVLVAIWSIVARHNTFGRRAMWAFIFAIAFVVEYKLIRHWFPGESRGLDFYQKMLLGQPGELLLGGGMWSLTTLMTLPLALLYPIAWLLLKKQMAPSWEQNFFLYNCLAFPLWIVFYRVQGGNINEFRIMWPFIMPLVVGLAWCDSAHDQKNSTEN